MNVRKYHTRWLLHVRPQGGVHIRQGGVRFVLNMCMVSYNRTSHKYEG
jgi:hypothetical protein